MYTQIFWVRFHFLYKLATIIIKLAIFNFIKVSARITNGADDSWWTLPKETNTLTQITKHLFFKTLILPFYFAGFKNISLFA